MSNEGNSLYEFGGFRFDGGKHKLWQGGEPVLLSPKASLLLCLLLERQGEFVSKEEIFEKVWSETFVEDGVLTQNIYTLRKVLGSCENGQPLIENRIRLGYRITVPIRFTEASNDNLNGKEILLATQTRTEIVTEEFIEEGALKSPLVKWSGRRRRKGAILAASLILLGGLALFGYLFLRPSANFSRNSTGNIHFQKVTERDDILFPTLSPDGNLTAYRKNGDAIYVRDLRTGAESRLEISNVKLGGFLAFSKDSNFLYIRNRSSFFLPAKVFKISRFGGEGLEVAENVWSGFSFSPDEKQMAFVRSFPKENRQSLILKNLETGDERELFALNFPQTFLLRNYPAWSPDGKMLAVVTAAYQTQGFSKIVVIDTENGQTEDLVIKDFRGVEQVVWLPKDNSFAAVAREGKDFQVWKISRDGLQVRRLINDLNNYRFLSVSADGTKLLTSQFIFFSNLWIFDEENPQIKKQLTFGTSNRDGYYGIDYFSNGELVYASNDGASGDINLWRLDPNDNRRRQLTMDAGSRNEYPAASPDDKFIYFVSNRGGAAHIWRIEAGGDNSQQITFGENFNESFPQVSPGGEYLYFIRKDKQSSAVWRKALASGAEEKITGEAQFVPTNILALSPDGKYLGFHNLTEQIDSENTKQAYQVAVIETANPQAIRFFNVDGAKVEIYWTADSAAFDYIDHPKGRDEIQRLSLDGKSEMQIIRTFPNEVLFYIAHAPGGKSAAVSYGQQLQDAVLLTNFE
ncbi:MAG: winged helix-turn-helix domain-containing protein [Pyrinomonadaceae bacterium]